VKEIFDEEGGCPGKTVCVDGCSRGCRCQTIEEVVVVAMMMRACEVVESLEARYLEQDEVVTWIEIVFVGRPCPPPCASRRVCVAAAATVLRSCSSCAPCDGWMCWQQMDCEISAFSSKEESCADVESKENSAYDESLNRRRPREACTCHCRAMQQMATVCEVECERSGPSSPACAVMVSGDGAWSEIWCRRWWAHDPAPASDPDGERKQTRAGKCVQRDVFRIGVSQIPLPVVVQTWP